MVNLCLIRLIFHYSCSNRLVFLDTLGFMFGKGKEKGMCNNVQRNYHAVQSVNDDCHLNSKWIMFGGYSVI